MLLFTCYNFTMFSCKQNYLLLYRQPLVEEPVTMCRISEKHSLRLNYQNILFQRYCAACDIILVQITHTITLYSVTFYSKNCIVLHTVRPMRVFFYNDRTCISSVQMKNRCLLLFKSGTKMRPTTCISQTQEASISPLPWKMSRAAVVLKGTSLLTFMRYLIKLMNKFVCFCRYRSYQMVFNQPIICSPYTRTVGKFCRHWSSMRHWWSRRK